MPKPIVFLVIVVMLSLQISSGNSANDSLNVPALYVFGDSLFDSGNNNLLPTLAKANYAPYGMDFHGGATGRFTNGKLVVDFIAEFLGLPHPPPYLSISRALLQSNKLTGLNFASGACGILPETGKQSGKCLNIVDQVDIFEKTVKEDLPKHYENAEDLPNDLSRSLFMISVGNNDYMSTYLDRYAPSKQHTPKSFTQLLINQLSLQLQRLYQLGARKVVVFELGPIGCMPAKTREYKHDGQCVEEINKLAVLFNNELASTLQNLTSKLVGSSFILGHAHWLGYDAAINPSKYGLADSTKACCKTWLNGTSGCIPGLGALACKNPEKNYFWDAFHLTETMYRTIATHCFNGTNVCVPKNIEQLVSQP